MGIIKAIYLLIRAFLLSRLSMAVENLALRQQVAVYQHTVKRPKLLPRDRIFWVWRSRLWSNWRSALAIVQFEMVDFPAPAPRYISQARDDCDDEDDAYDYSP